jgi:hypothetical protein
MDGSGKYTLLLTPPSTDFSRIKDLNMKTDKLFL